MTAGRRVHFVGRGVRLLPDEFSIGNGETTHDLFVLVARKDINALADYNGRRVSFAHGDRPFFGERIRRPGGGRLEIRGDAVAIWSAPLVPVGGSTDESR